MIEWHRLVFKNSRSIFSVKLETPYFAKKVAPYYHDKNIMLSTPSKKMKAHRSGAIYYRYLIARKCTWSHGRWKIQKRYWKFSPWFIPNRDTPFLSQEGFIYFVHPKGRPVRLLKVVDYIAFQKWVPVFYVKLNCIFCMEVFLNKIEPTAICDEERRRQTINILPDHLSTVMSQGVARIWQKPWVVSPYVFVRSIHISPAR